MCKFVPKELKHWDAGSLLYETIAISSYARKFKYEEQCCIQGAIYSERVSSV